MLHSLYYLISYHIVYNKMFYHLLIKISSLFHWKT